MTHRSLLAGLAALALMVATVGSSALASSPDSTTRRMALGVSMLPDTDMAVYRKFRADSGRWPATWSIWSNWGGSDSRLSHVPP